MKKLVTTIFALFISISTAHAERYASDFGFTIDIPGHWTIMSKKELANESGRIDTSHPSLQNWDQELLGQVMAMIESGQIEAYFNTRTSTANFQDNINVLKQPGNTVPGNQYELDELCQLLPNYLSQTFGRTIRSYRCEFATVAGNKAIYVDFDGALPNTRSMQYQINYRGYTYVITATCANDRVGEISREFDAMVNSIRF